MTRAPDPAARRSVPRAHPIHLADLLRMTATLPRAEWPAAADAMGYRWQPPVAAAALPEHPTESETNLRSISPTPEPAEPVAVESITQTLPTLWRIAADLHDHEASIEPDWMREPGPEGCFESDGQVVLPRPAPLVGRSRLARFLRRQLAVDKPGTRVDLPWAVTRLARLEPLLPLRRQTRQRWPQRVQLVVQTDPALGPLAQDLRALGAHLRRWLGDRLRWLECPGGPQRLVDLRQRPARLRSDGSRVVVLGDGGTYQASERVRDDWRHWAARLERCGSRPLLLAPVPRRRCDGELAAAFDLALLDESPRLRLQSAAKKQPPVGFDSMPQGDDPSATSDEALAALTALLAGLAAVEPALLRLTRRALRTAGVRHADVATEVEFLQQPEVDCDGFYCRVKPGAAAAVIDRWRSHCAGVLNAAPLVARVGGWARSLSPLLQAERAETWRRHWPEALALADSATPAAADRVWRWLAGALTQPRHRQARSLQSYLFWLGRSNPDLVGGGPIALQAAWLLANRDHLQRSTIPAGIAWERMSWLCDLLQLDGEKQALQGEGRGPVLRAVVGPAARISAAAALRRDLPGSGHFRFEAIDCELDDGAATGSTIRHGRAARSGQAFDLDASHAWRLHIGPRRLVVEAFVPPAWAEAVWRDGTEWFAAPPEGRRLRWVPRRTFALEGVIHGRPEYTLPRGAWWDDAESRPFADCDNPIACPPWANAGHGTDRFGWWAAFQIGGASQKMRFVAPGQVSPSFAHREGWRGGDEPPLPVMLTRGYWIADTTCTQALWQAVTNASPSRFAGDPDAPGAQTSGDTARSQFLVALAAAAPQLHMRLATAAECECATWDSRAAPGRTLDTSTGDTDVDFRLARSMTEPDVEASTPADGADAGGDHRPDAQAAAMLPLPPVFPFAWAVAHGLDRYGLWQAFEVNGVRQRLRWLPPGQFWMGSPVQERGRYDDETLHRVRLSVGFWLGETVVTQALWLAVMGGENPARFQGGPTHPVECVSWHDIQDGFLPALARAVPGLAARLPWEAEWEYACREAGKATGPFCFGEELSAEAANFDGRVACRGQPPQPFRGRTVAVDTFAPNAVGLREMHGGVCEWCADWCVAYPAADVIDPHGPPSGGRAPKRVVRGGSWISYARSCRSAYRYANDPGHRFVNIGFRLACGPCAEDRAPATTACLARR